MHGLTVGGQVGVVQLRQLLAELHQEGIDVMLDLVAGDVGRLYQQAEPRGVQQRRVTGADHIAQLLLGAQALIEGRVDQLAQYRQPRLTVE